MAQDPQAPAPLHQMQHSWFHTVLVMVIPRGGTEVLPDEGHLLCMQDLVMLCPAQTAVSCPQGGLLCCLRGWSRTRHRFLPLAC